MQVNLPEVAHRDTVLFLENEKSQTKAYDQLVRTFPIFSLASKFDAVESLSFPLDEDFGDLCFVFVDACSKSKSLLADSDFWNNLNRLRQSHHKTAFILAAIVDGESPVDDLVVAGADLLLSVDGKGLWGANLYAYARSLRMVVKPDKPKFIAGEQNRRTFGAWTFLTSKNAVELPDQSVVRLPPTEWQFVQYLLTRDYFHERIPEDLEQSIGKAENLKALVHKVKRKLGSDFPISFSKEKGYHLVSER